MGADSKLMEAAGKMGPKAWDYSGLMKGIAALGKYALDKKVIADDLTTYGDKEFSIKEIPEEMMEGMFGDLNMSFFTDLKDVYDQQKNIIKKPLNHPRGKKYKNAVKTINKVKSALELNKADLLTWAEVRKNVDENWQNKSNAITRGVFHRVADLQINNSFGDMNAASLFTLDGLKIYASDILLM